MIKTCWEQVAQRQGWDRSRSADLYKSILKHYQAPERLFHNVGYLKEAIYFASEFGTTGQMRSRKGVKGDEALNPVVDALKVALYLHAGFAPGDKISDMLAFVGADDGFTKLVMSLIVTSNTQEIANELDILGRTMVDATLLPFIAADYGSRETALLAEVEARPDVQNMAWLSDRLQAMHDRESFFMHPSMVRFDEEAKTNVAGTLMRIEMG